VNALTFASQPFIASDRTYGARRVWRDMIAEGTAWSAKCYMNMRPLYQPQVMQTEAVA
jgi:hypothetical protein